MVVIADHERAVALGGVMGGEHSEVGENTVDLLIEAADFCAAERSSSGTYLAASLPFLLSI